MAEYIIQEETLIDIADAIREKEGGSGEVGPVTLTWDGDTTGKVYIEAANPYGGTGIACKVSDLILTDEEIKAGTYVTNSGETRNVADEWDDLVNLGVVTEEYTSITGVAFIRKDNLEADGFVYPEAGVYFASLNGTVLTTSFTTMAALGKALIPVPDFAPRILALSGGEQATPEISVDENGLITATAGDKSATKQLSTQSGKTITPGPTEQIAVAAGKYVTGDVIVAAVENTGGGDGSPYVVNVHVNISASVSVTEGDYIA